MYYLVISHKENTYSLIILYRYQHSGITTVLTINELRLNIYKDDASAGRYLNLYDIYSFVCFFFVFAGLIEYSMAQSIDIKYRLRDFYKAQQVRMIEH